MTKSYLGKYIRPALPSSFIILSNLVFCIVLLCPGMIYSQSDGAKKLLTKLDKNLYSLNEMVINTDQRTISMPCKVNMTEGLIEVLVCRPEGKVHESLFVTAVSPLELQTALLLLGADPVNELPDESHEGDPLSPYRTIETVGDSLLIFVKREDGQSKQMARVEDFIRDESKKKTLVSSTWLFRGAVTLQNGTLVLDPDMTMIATYHDPIALIELNAIGKFDDELYYVNTEPGLKKGESIELIIKAIK